jgi:cytoplasmic iron level regulating protein YaaA (DUF328/UPF0246 family)
MLVLLSPSKTQDFDAAAPRHAFTQPALLNESQALIRELRKLEVPQIAGLMGISRKLAELNRDRYHHFRTPFTPGNARQAVFAFKGDVYEGLDAGSLDEAAIGFAQAHIRILSGLYGVLRPLDLIQPYRLEMRIRLKNRHGADLYAFWGDRLTRLIAQELATHDSKVIVNLASQEYFKAIHAETLSAELITPTFKEKKSGGYRMIGLLAKKARGLMARYIVRQHITHPEALQFFAEDGYRFNVALSKPGSPVYTRG